MILRITDRHTIRYMDTHRATQTQTCTHIPRNYAQQNIKISSHTPLSHKYTHQKSFKSFVRASKTPGIIPNTRSSRPNQTTSRIQCEQGLRGLIPRDDRLTPEEYVWGLVLWYLRWFVRLYKVVAAPEWTGQVASSSFF